MIKKAYETKKEIKEFKEQYSNGDLETEVISNLLQPFHKDKYPAILKYCEFWWSEDRTDYGLLGVLQIMLSKFGQDALKDKFGKHDFSFEGNRMYKNYILEFDGLLIVAPSKREVVLNKNRKLREKLVQFENSYTQLVVDYVMSNYINLESYEKEHLEKLKKAGILSEDNKIDFDYKSKLKVTKKLK